MDFYHVLPSNTSPNYFPNNNASQYSTPLDNPYNLPGNWEVALTDVNYSTCVNTFNNDTMVVEETCSLKACIQRSNRAYKVMLPVPTNHYDIAKARKEMAGFITTSFEGLLQLTITSDGKWGDWKLLTDDYYFILSPDIRIMYQLWADGLTPWDDSHRNFTKFSFQNVPRTASDLFIIIVPTKSNKFQTETTYTLKDVNETITAEQLLERFERKVPQTVAKFTLNAENNHLCLYKLHNDNHMILVNKPLRAALTYRRASMFHKAYQKYRGFYFTDKSKEWVFTIITFEGIPIFRRDLKRTITLPTHSFENENNAVTFINQKVNDERIKFSFDTTTKRITLNISDKSLTLTVDNNLRDIFGFDNNSYSGILSYTAKRTFSLYRCIQFLYIYSSLSEYVRIGNTEAPLIGIVPFSHDNKCSLLKQKTFKTPMYIRVSHDRISQIDIGIYDGAGQLVPFAADAVSTLRLHFRPT